LISVTGLFFGALSTLIEGVNAGTWEWNVQTGEA